MKTSCLFAGLVSGVFAFESAPTKPKTSYNGDETKFEEAKTNFINSYVPINKEGKLGPSEMMKTPWKAPTCATGAWTMSAAPGVIVLKEALQESKDADFGTWGKVTCTPGVSPDSKPKLMYQASQAAAAAAPEELKDRVPWYGLQLTFPEKFAGESIPQQQVQVYLPKTRANFADAPYKVQAEIRRPSGAGPATPVTLQIKTLDAGGVVTLSILATGQSEFTGVTGAVMGDEVTRAEAKEETAVQWKDGATAEMQAGMTPEDVVKLFESKHEKGTEPTVKMYVVEVKDAKKALVRHNPGSGQQEVLGGSATSVECKDVNGKLQKADEEDKCKAVSEANELNPGNFKCKDEAGKQAKVVLSTGHNAYVLPDIEGDYKSQAVEMSKVALTDRTGTKKDVGTSMKIEKITVKAGKVAVFSISNGGDEFSDCTGSSNSEPQGCEWWHWGLIVVAVLAVVVVAVVMLMPAAEDDEDDDEDDDDEDESDKNEP
jgi:hypothetical protein